MAADPLSSRDKCQSTSSFQQPCASHPHTWLLDLSTPGVDFCVPCRFSLHLFLGGQRSPIRILVCVRRRAWGSGCIFYVKQIYITVFIFCAQFPQEPPRPLLLKGSQEDIPGNNTYKVCVYTAKTILLLWHKKLCCGCKFQFKKLCQNNNIFVLLQWSVLRWFNTVISKKTKFANYFVTNTFFAKPM